MWKCLHASHLHEEAEGKSIGHDTTVCLGLIALSTLRASAGNLIDGLYSPMGKPDFMSLRDRLMAPGYGGGLLKTHQQSGIMWWTLS